MTIELPDEWFECESHRFPVEDGITLDCSECGMPVKFQGIEDYAE